MGLNCNWSLNGGEEKVGPSAKLSFNSWSRTVTFEVEGIEVPSCNLAASSFFLSFFL
jgi:hypothetical protein